MDTNEFDTNKNEQLPEENSVKKRKLGKKGKIALITVGVILFLFATTIAVGYGIFHHYFGLMQELPGGDIMANTQVPWENPATPNPGVTLAPGVTPVPGATETPEPTPVPTEIPDEPLSPTLSPEEKNDVDEELKNPETTFDQYDTKVFNIMLVGIDNRDSKSFWGNSDAMILVSINTKKKVVTMTSFLRDTYAYVPGYDEPTRLNHAYARGYSPLMVATFKQNFGIEIDRCVVVNFFVLADFVEAIGGIDLELSAAEIKVMNDYIEEYNHLVGNPDGTDYIAESAAGKLHVNGSQALAYCRVRYVGSDVARTGRQRTVILKAIEKAKSMSIGEITSLANQFLPRVATDLTEGDCLMLLTQSLSLSRYKFQQMVFPEAGTYRNAYISGMEVLVIDDLDANLRKWHSLVGEK